MVPSSYLDLSDVNGMDWCGVVCGMETKRRGVKGACEREGCGTLSL